MKVTLLAGGMGTRLAEETETRPKPMVEIGDRPVLWHIMRHFAHYGFKEFCIALGYKGDLIKHYFMDYARLTGSMSLDLKTGAVNMHDRTCEDWTIHLVETGLDTLTGGRVKRMQPWLGDETFIVTYGDGVADVNLPELVKFHRSHGKIATVTAVRPPSRFGALVIEGDLVTSFDEKPQVGEGWINGGFLVFEPKVFDYLEGDKSVLEVHALERLAADRQLAVFKHDRFWQCMDTIRDKRYLESLWQTGNAPWRIWK